MTDRSSSHIQPKSYLNTDLGNDEIVKFCAIEDKSIYARSFSVPTGDYKEMSSILADQ